MQAICKRAVEICTACTGVVSDPLPARLRVAYNWAAYPSMHLSSLIWRGGSLLAMVSCLCCGGGGSSSSTDSTTTTTTTSSANWKVVASSGSVVEGTGFIGTDNRRAAGGVTKGEVAGDFDIVIISADTTHGWAVGNLGEILKSTDSGTTASGLEFPSSGRLQAVAPVTTTHVWLAGSDSVGGGASVWVTTNGGTSWSTQYDTAATFTGRSITTTDHLNALFFFDENTGLVAGGLGNNTGLIARTTDGGTTWTTVYNTATAGTDDELQSLVFANASVGYAAGNRGVVLKSTDAGVTWSNLTAGLTCPDANTDNCDLFDIRCADISTCYVAGERGWIAKTTDGGATWSNLTTGTTEDLSALAVRSTKIWAGGNNGKIIYSSNSGTSFAAQTSNTTYPVQAIHMVTDDTGFAACANTAVNTGAILKTTTGGQ